MAIIPTGPRDYSLYWNIKSLTLNYDGGLSSSVQLSSMRGPVISEPAAGSLWIVGSVDPYPSPTFDTIYLVSAADGTVSRSLPINGPAAGFAGDGIYDDGTNLWLLGSEGSGTFKSIYRIDKSTGAELDSFVTESQNAYGLVATASGGFWIANAGGGQTEFWLLDSTGAFVDWFDRSAIVQGDITWDGTNLRIAETNDAQTAPTSDVHVTVVDTTGAVQNTIPLNVPIAEDGVFIGNGLAWDGSNMWVTDDKGLKLYQVDESGNVLKNFDLSFTPLTMTWAVDA